MNLYRPGSIPKRIMERAEALPEGTPLCPKGFLDLGNRAAVDQAFSRLVREGRLLRICQGVHMRPEPSPYGPLPPDVDQAISRLATLWGETIVPNGGQAANNLRLITQVPIRPVYWTSGRDRRLLFGRLPVTLLHETRWKLLLPGRLSGMVLRALAFLGPHETRDALRSIATYLKEADIAELLEARPALPTSIAGPISEVLAHA
ncbi:MAG: DUF6088 family protein [Acidobacteria bacterium]|nr:DUF6088 family protein [Acidobacteriota bacterium]